MWAAATQAWTSTLAFFGTPSSLLPSTAAGCTLLVIARPPLRAIPRCSLTPALQKTSSTCDQSSASQSCRIQHFRRRQVRGSDGDDLSRSTVSFYCRDYEGGHGTHVVGSILGNSIPTSFPGFENGTFICGSCVRGSCRVQRVTRAVHQAPGDTTAWLQWRKSLSST